MISFKIHPLSLDYTTSSTRSHQRAKIAEQPTSKYREYFTNDVKSVSMKKYVQGCHGNCDNDEMEPKTPDSYCQIA